MLLDVPAASRLLYGEGFGPIMPFASTEEALALANDTPFGLAAYVFTRDLSQATKAAEALDSGIIGLNDMVPATAECPFAA